VAVKLHIRKTLLARFLLSRWGKIFVVLSVVTLAACVGIFSYYYVKYGRMIEDKLAAGPYPSTSMLYAAPRPVMVGDDGQIQEIASYLRRCGYTESNTSRLGWYHLRPDAIEINPGPDAYDSEGATIKVDGKKVTQIISLRDHTERTRFMLEPELMTSLFDRARVKRRVVKFDEIPLVMRNALLSAEDKHFFQHMGFDPVGIVRAAYVDLKQGRGGQGASTLSQQLARTLWLGPERGLQRKIPETFITLYLEQKLSKPAIFEFYANSIYLGNVGSFSINGFGEGSLAYFGKDLKMISLPEAATLAGLINSPRRRNPFYYPDEAKKRRNVVLKLMRENGQISQRDYEDAVASELKVAPRDTAESTDAPYFVDLVNQTLQDRFQDRDFQTESYRVYTTLDMNLERDAVQAVREGIKETDDQWKRRNKKYGTNEENPLAQVALICLDAETGELKALVGGRNYGVSQLDHALRIRQPGSSFKPFVYAAAFTQALQGGAKALTPASTVVDEPTTFYFEEQEPYEPHNHGDKYQFGPVTLRYALAHSLNIPAVKVAEMVGYDNVAKTARAVGLNINIKPTPSIALGAYEVTPLEIAGAYTVFTNNGDLVKPSFIKTIRDQHGADIFEETPKRTPHALDPRVAYLVENMLEEVLRSGTGAEVHSRGFNLPAAGKTGTSRDGWFAGFTSKLICVVWVGFDDNRDFKLEGAHSALPIWTSFMKLAHNHREYAHVHGFSAPDGIVTADIDPESGQLATANCPKTHSEVFLAGTQPIETCALHGGGTQISDWNSDKKTDDPSKKGKGFINHLKAIFK
jgi:penicillin-binding protein 1B